MRFSPKDPEEVVTLTFDFTNDLAGGKTITPASPAFTITMAKGTDANAQQMLIGAAGISGALVLQNVELGLDGNDYEFRCAIDTNTAEHFVLPWVLPVRRRDG